MYLKQFIDEGGIKYSSSDRLTFQEAIAYRTCLWTHIHSQAPNFFRFPYGGGFIDALDFDLVMVEAFRNEGEQPA